MENNVAKGAQILKDWPYDDEGGKRRLITNFYQTVERERKKPQAQRNFLIVPDIIYIDQWQILLNTLLHELGDSGMNDLLIYLLENDRRYVNNDVLSNYKEQLPFPSYLIQMAYLILFALPPKIRTRKLFEALWEHQAKVKPGIDESCSKKFLDPFIEEGITTKQEIQDLIIRDWKRWQESPDDSPYYGEPYGVAVWYFPNYSWDSVKKKLEDEWRKKTGREPKK